MTCVDSPAVPARLERAQSVIAEGRVSQSPYEPVGYEVVSSDGLRTYLVQLEGPSLCTCPDHQHRHIHCKHYLAAGLFHLAAIAARENRAVRSQPVRRAQRTLQRAVPRRGHPIWYGAAPEPASVRCADCGRSDCRGSYKPDGNHGLAF